MSGTTYRGSGKSGRYSKGGYDGGAASGTLHTRSHRGGHGDLHRGGRRTTQETPTSMLAGKVHRQAAEVTGVVREPRRGVYYASELLHHRDARAYQKEFKALEKVCIIRFPPDIASLLRQRLAAHQAGLDCSFSAEDVPMGPLETSELGLTITPTPGEDYRLFNVAVEKRLGNPHSTLRLTGVLVELPCLVEAYKSLEGELLFKSNDISQMLYVYDPKASAATGGPPFDLKQIRDSQLWEWHGGITPGTHRIRHRRFKNFNVFDKADVAAAEREICNILNQRTTHETCVLEASTEYVMEEQLEALKTGLDQNVTAVIGPENPLLYAAAHQVSPAAAAPQFDVSNQKATALLRRFGELQVSAFASLKDRLRFSSNPEITVDEDGGIPDDLSDKLFGELKIETDQAQDEAQLEEEVRGLAYSSLATSVVHSSSDASMSSEEDAKTRKERRQKKKEKVKPK